MTNKEQEMMKIIFLYLNAKCNLTCTHTAGIILKDHGSHRNNRDVN